MIILKYESLGNGTGWRCSERAVERYQGPRRWALEVSVGTSRKQCRILGTTGPVMERFPMSHGINGTSFLRTQTLVN